MTSLKDAAVTSKSPESREGAKLFALTEQLSRKHNDEAGKLQNLVDRCTSILGHPAFFLVLTAVIVGWMALNLCIYWFHLSSIDPAPFVWLDGAITTLDLYCVVLVLSTQRRGEKLMSQLERLSVEMAVVSDEKSSKLIQLLENARRREEGVGSVRDEEADRLATRIDHTAISSAIRDI